MYRLLVVDDEPDILKGITRLVPWPDYDFTQVETAGSYPEAVEKSMMMHPDITLVDVCIGETRGYEMIGRLQELGLKTKFIMMSGYDTFEYVRRSMTVGAKDYLLKPVERQTLLKCIEKIITEDFHGTFANRSAEHEARDPVLNVPYSEISNLTNKILLMIREEYAHNLTLKAVADKFKMNSTYMGQIFLKETKMKFSEYLMVYRMQEARRRIENSSDKIAVVAHDVGYANLNYFYTHFHSYFGLSPSDLRGA